MSRIFASCICYWLINCMLPFKDGKKRTFEGVLPNKQLALQKLSQADGWFKNPFIVLGDQNSRNRKQNL